MRTKEGQKTTRTMEMMAGSGGHSRRDSGRRQRNERRDVDLKRRRMYNEKHA